MRKYLLLWLCHLSVSSYWAGDQTQNHKVAHWVSWENSNNSVQEKRHLRTFSPKFPLSIQEHVIQEHLFCSFLKEATHKTLSNTQAEVKQLC